MIPALKVFAMCCLALISYQDLKTRSVTALLFVLLGISLSLLFRLHSPLASVYGYQLLLNLCLTAIMILLVYLTTRLIFKKRFLDHSLGLGDILFFVAMAVGFPSFTFLILLVSALLLALLVSLIYKATFIANKIPLAGLMSFFLLVIIALSLFLKQPSLYTY